MVIRTGSASIALAAIATLASVSFCPVQAQAQAPTRFDIPAQDLGTSLRLVGSISGRQIIIATGAVEGRTAPALRGTFRPDDAISKLLAGTGVSVRFNSDAALIGATVTGSVDADASSAAGEITVTGTRIRGAHPTSPVIAISRDQMLSAGETSLGEVVRDIPQSFAGGQNPNVLQSSGGGDGNLNSASTINLRGLGPAATLTLVNGHRISYDGASQAVDVSAIPVAAIDRLEVVADGASAIYGSDAVGGVANIILRRDFNGLETDARLGGATSGGDFQQQYDVVTGARWATGGFIATYNFERDTEINAGQRSFTKSLNYSTTLLPFITEHSGILSGHQSIGADVTLSLDGTFNHRESADNIANLLSEPAENTGRLRSQSTTSYSVAPRIDWRVPYNWLVAISGIYGWDKTNFVGTNTSRGVTLNRIPGYYTDTSKIIEFSAEGPLLKLPAGDVRLALGAGHRTIGLRGFGKLEVGGSSIVLTDYRHARSSNYGYGEIYIPLVEPLLNIPGVARLETTAAVRYESYGVLGNIATPKFGMSYAPVRDLTFKATWGKSFKTPTLYQQYSGYVAQLFSPSVDFGVTNAPAGSSVLYLSGGNPNLKSEKATSWTAGANFSPQEIPGLSIEGSYFNVDYRNKIGSVGVDFNGALSNSLYNEVITRSPTAIAVNDIIDGADQPILNFSGGDFDPGNVLASIDDRLLNISREKVSGVDLAVALNRTFSGARSLALTGSATYLRSTQQLLDGSPSDPVAGTVYHPPHWRRRAGGTWSDHGFSASAFVNYVGSVTDNSQQPFQKVRSMTTLDAVLRITSSDQSPIVRGLAMTIAITNLLDEKPANIRVTDAILSPYDSTNYSAVGRFISVTLSKHW